MKKIIILFAIVATLFECRTARAQFPRIISYQGYVTQSGSAVSGAHTLQLKLYPDSTSNAALFSGSEAVTLISGVFSTVIGPIPAGVDFSAPLWLGISIDGGTELTPRAQLTVAPYALYSAESQHAKVADALSSGPINYVTSITSNDNTITVKAPSIHQPSGDVVDIGVDSVVASRVVPPNGMQVGQTMQWSASGWIGAYLNVPVGTVLAFAGDTAGLAAQGWLLCDGRSLKNTDYPELYAVIHAANGESGGNFWLPDYRGLFLRGVNYNRSDAYADPDNSASSRPALHAGGNLGNKVGSVQADQFMSHSHTYDGPSANSTNANFTYGQLSSQVFNCPTATTNNAGGNETRPKNAYVNWIIKAKP